MSAALHLSESEPQGRELQAEIQQRRAELRRLALRRGMNPHHRARLAALIGTELDAIGRLQLVANTLSPRAYQSARERLDMLSNAHRTLADMLKQMDAGGNTVELRRRVRALRLIVDDLAGRPLARTA